VIHRYVQIALCLGLPGCVVIDASQSGGRPDPVRLGQPVTYTIALRTLNADTGIVLTDVPPAGATLVSATASQGTCTGAAPVVCSIGALDANVQATVTIVVVPQATGRVTNTATLRSDGGCGEGDEEEDTRGCMLALVTEVDDCASDTACADDDACTADRCDVATHLCSHTRTVTAMSRPVLRIAGLGTPPGDDRLVFRGALMLPAPLIVDPVANGIRFVVRTAAGATVTAAEVGPGPFEAHARKGWKSPRPGRWSYVDRTPSPPAGIVRVQIRARSSGGVRVVVTGRRGAYGLGTSDPSLEAELVLDPTRGPCGGVAFPTSSCRFHSRASVVECAAADGHAAPSVVRWEASR